MPIQLVFFAMKNLLFQVQKFYRACDLQNNDFLFLFAIQVPLEINAKSQILKKLETKKHALILAKGICFQR